MPLAGARPTQPVHPAIQARAEQISEVAAAELMERMRAAGVELAGAKVVEELPEVLAAAMAFAVRDELLVRFDRGALGLVDDGYAAVVEGGAARMEGWRRIGQLAGRREAGTRFGFGRARSARAASTRTP